ncbi:hypothetical protein GX645_01745 [Candidatus Sumerlaeota bacterium]|nr:hypothetical protein [Candidatus Sumerlaeota bacterium]
MSLTLQNPLKDPSAVLDYVFDWNEWLATGETITDHTITADTGITVDSSTEDAGKVTVWLSGGTAGINYKVACLITTSAGRTDERTIWIKVTDR